MPNLTIHLLRTSVQHHYDAVGLEAKHFSIDEDERHIGDLYVAPKPEKSPAWAGIFKDHIDDIKKLGTVKSTGAVLIVKAKGRFFALTFGQGRFILNQDMIEERFGLLATLNSLEANALRSIDKRTFDTVDQNSRVQVGLTSNASDFGVDIERDLIKGIVGYPKRPELLGRRMSGSDALTVSREIDLGAIRKVLTVYLRAYESAGYKEHFAWIDQIHQVRKKGHLAAALDELLIEKLTVVRAQGGRGGDCWLAAPDVLDWDEVEGFRYSQSKGDGYQTDMHLLGFFGVRRRAREDADQRQNSSAHRRISRANHFKRTRFGESFRFRHSCLCVWSSWLYGIGRRNGDNRRVAYGPVSPRIFSECH